MFLFGGTYIYYAPSRRLLQEIFLWVERKYEPLIIHQQIFAAGGEAQLFVQGKGGGVFLFGVEAKVAYAVDLRALDYLAYQKRGAAFFSFLGNCVNAAYHAVALAACGKAGFCDWPFAVKESEG